MVAGSDSIIKLKVSSAVCIRNADYDGTSYDSQVFFQRPRYEWLSRMSRHAKKLRDHDINPCVAETDATTKCMSDNNYNKDLCTDYFLKYKNCRTFWHEIMMQRKRSGVKPEMPSAEERKKILESMGKPY